MNKIERFEQIYIKFIWIFSAIGVLYVIFPRVIDGSFQRYLNQIMLSLFFFALYVVINIFKLKFIKKGLFSKAKVYFTYRMIELPFLALASVFLRLFGRTFNIDIWAYLVFLFLITIISLCKGSKNGFIAVLYASSIHFVFRIITEVFFPDSGIINFGFFLSNRFLLDTLYYLASALLAVICGTIYKETVENEVQNRKLLEQLEEKYDQLAIAQEEIKYQYEKLKETNTKLEDTNKKLTASIGEFYTVQQITQAISSIFDIKELLKHVNDIILGVMGVNYSTIILYDEKKRRFKVNNTNIKNHDELIVLNDNINCEILQNVLDSGRLLIENFVDPDEYAFTHGRDVNSLIIAPFGTKTRKFGLVLIEHKFYSAFDEGNVRLIDIISQQVGIAMENAELYQKMHELATVDGLTGVYNRLYFQERLEKEFKSAKEENYKLSLAIFDIDHFKKFNDTYGHLFGDRVIKFIAETVKNSLRSSDLIARFGGEEFVMLFPHMGLKEACDKVEKLRETIANILIKDNHISVSVTVSFGVSCYPETSRNENELVRNADDALYEAKASGRNCVKAASNL